MGATFSKNQFPVNGRTVLITGGSRGMGLNAGRQLAAKGANIIVVARDKDVLRDAITSIADHAKSPDTQRFHQISADMMDSSECYRVMSEAAAWNLGKAPDIVWCASGSSHPTLFVDTPLEVFQRMMDSNYFSCVYMAHAVLNTWLKQTANKDLSSTPSAMVTSEPVGSSLPLPRHLIFTGSFLSFFPIAGFTPYSPSKAAIRSLADSLSQEMNLYAGAHPTQPRVKIHAVFPGTMPTKSYEEENRVKCDLTKSLEEGDTVLSPEEVARRAIAGLESGEELVATSFLVRLVMTSALSGSLRGGFFKGLANTILSWIVAIVMVFVRGDLDSKIRKWGQRYGSSGMKEAGRTS